MQLLPWLPWDLVQDTGGRMDVQSYETDTGKRIIVSHSHFSFSFQVQLYPDCYQWRSTIIIFIILRLFKISAFNYEKNIIPVWRTANHQDSTPVQLRKWAQCASGRVAVTPCRTHLVYLADLVCMLMYVLPYRVCRGTRGSEETRFVTSMPHGDVLSELLAVI